MTAAAKRKPLDREALIANAKLAAKVQGCACNPNVRVRELRPQIYSAEIGHEYWCPLVGGTGQ
jgi:hypothetical protein